LKQRDLSPKHDVSPRENLWYISAPVRSVSVERGKVVTDSDAAPLAMSVLEREPESLVSSKLLGCWIDAHIPTAQIEQITALATMVLEDRDKAVQWLSAANPATDDRAPIELIGEPQGFERVKNVLLRIEYGVLA
jgi:Protein of unknown function (DUF2384)